MAHTCLRHSTHRLRMEAFRACHAASRIAWGSCSSRTALLRSSNSRRICSHPAAAEAGDKPLVILGIESSCDDTAAAVVTSDGRVLGEAIATQADLHAPWGGVVPNLAQQAHRYVQVLALLLVCSSGHGCCAKCESPSCMTANWAAAVTRRHCRCLAHERLRIHQLQQQLLLCRW
jgi:hypothetical protein